MKVSLSNSKNPQSRLRVALARTWPVLLGYIPLGMAFGVLLVKAGYPWYLAPLMSVLMYAGSGQLLAVGFFLNDPGLAGIILATALVQMRHMFYGLSLLRPFLSFSRSRWYMMHALTDETYALLTGLSVEERSDEKLCLLICGLDHLWWILGGILGAVAGSLLPWDMKGLEFTLTALFTVLALEKLRDRRGLRSGLAGAASGLIALLLLPSHNMLLGALAICLCTMLIFEARRGNDHL